MTVTPPRPSMSQADDPASPGASRIEAPPPEEVAPGRSGRGALYRLHTPMASRALPWVMPYAFVPARGDAGVTLFDAGYGTPEAAVAMERQLAALGFTPADVERLIVSHVHPDHVGMAGWLRRQNPHLELVMHRREADLYASMERGHDRWEAEMRTWGLRHGFAVADLEQAQEERLRREAARGGGSEGATGGATDDAAGETERRSWEMEHVPPSRLVEDGEELAFAGWRLIAVWTPGHTPGHLCAHLPDEGLTFTGDHVLSRITPNVSYHSEDDEGGRNPLAEFLDSLEKVAALDSRMGLPAHEAVIADLPARCRAIEAHHDVRAAEVLAGITTGEGGATAYEVASRVTWNRPWETFGVWKRRSAVGETLAHLRLLESQGRVRRVEDDDGVVHWLPAR